MECKRGKGENFFSREKIFVLSPHPSSAFKKKRGTFWRLPALAAVLYLDVYQNIPGQCFFWVRYPQNAV